VYRNLGVQVEGVNFANSEIIPPNLGRPPPPFPPLAKQKGSGPEYSVLRSQINRLKCAGYVSGSAHRPDRAINQEIFYYAKTAATLIGT
jgi:hypothetical protein